MLTAKVLTIDDEQTIEQRLQNFQYTRRGAHHINLRELTYVSKLYLVIQPFSVASCGYNFCIEWIFSMQRILQTFENREADS